MSAYSRDGRGFLAGDRSTYDTFLQTEFGRWQLFGRLRRPVSGETGGMRFLEVPGLGQVSRVGLGTWQFGSREWGYGEGYAQYLQLRVLGG